MRENLVFLHGQVAIKPRIHATDTGELIKASFAVKVLRRPFIGPNGRMDSRLYFDCPIILTMSQELIQTAAKLCLNDMVDIRGVLTTREVIKSTTCGGCGHKNSHPGNTVYVTPIYLCRREANLSPEDGLRLLKERNEISNMIVCIGTLCREPEFFEKDDFGKKRSNIQYQLAVNRKYRIREDSTSVRTDYPWVKCFGAQALEDKDCLHMGSSIYINGALQTREVVRTTVCEKCGASYEWKDTATEIIPYSVEYLADCNLPEPQERREGLEDEE